MSAASPDAAPAGVPAEPDTMPGTVAALRVILGLWRPRAGRLAAGAALSVASVLAGVALLALAGGTTVASAGGGSGAAPHAVLRIAGIVLLAGASLRALGLLRLLLRYVDRLATHDATFRALADTRVWFFRRVAASAASGLGYRRSADLLSRLVADVEVLDSLFLRITVPLLGALAVLPFLIWMLARRDLALALVVGALFLGAAAVVPAVAARLAGRAGERLGARRSALRVAVLDAVAGLREVRAFGAEGRVLASAQAREAVLITTQLEAARRSAIADAAGFLLGQAALLAVLAAIATGLAAGGAPGLSFAVIAVFIVLASFETATPLPRAGVLAGEAAAAARRVVAAAAPPADPGTRPRGGAMRAVPDDHLLRFEHVRFGWTPGRPVLDGVTFEVPAGSRVAILGPSGAGKSTIASLALGLAGADAGRVTLGGVDVSTIEPLALRRTITLLNQTSHLFADSIRANLLIGRPEATDEEIWAALEQAAIGRWVRSLPDGLSTWLGEGGHTVSGGQGRRIALARALLATAPILILDEPAAGLDAEAEAAFFGALNEGASGRTVILIAHRLTGVERIDRIWRLAGGKAAAAAA